MKRLLLFLSTLSLRLRNTEESVCCHFSFRNMNRKKNERIIFLLSILSLVYFGFLLLNAEYFRFESIALGVIRELFTIPVIVGQFILLYFAWKKFKLRGYSIMTYAFVAMIIVTGLICFILASFLIK